MEISSRKNINKWMIILILWGLIVFGTTVPIVSYIALAVSAITIVTFDDRNTIPVLFAIEPFANIFKASPNSQSFFTMLVFLYVGLKIIKQRRINKLVLLIAIYGMYLVMIQLFCNSLDVARTLKFVVNFVFLYYALVNSQQTEYQNIFVSYIGGIIVSSLVKLSGVFTNISKYVDTVMVGQVDFNNIARFAGLYNDPNYYAVNVIIAMCLVIILFHFKTLKTPYAIAMLGLLVLFVGLTSSKSAMLMLILPIMLLLYSNSKNRRHFIQLISIAAVVLCVLMVIAGRISIFDTVLGRFSQADNIEALTTGRSRIWKEYLGYFSEHGEVLIFGKGLGAQLISGEASHNTYIDIIYYLGIVGAALTLGLLLAISKRGDNQRGANNKKCLLNISLILCIAIMYTFLGQLFYFDLIFQLYLAIITWKIPFKNWRNAYEKRAFFSGTI